MTRRYSVFQAKLQEVESILDDMLLHGPKSTQSQHDTLSKDIKQKLVFIGNLLSAEVASHPTRPQHLHHISQRLATLEKAFHDWDTYRTLSREELDKDSTCSCTESCLNDDGDGKALDDTGLVVFEDPEEIFHDYVGGDKALVEFNGEEKNNVGFDKIASFVYEDAEESFEGFRGGDKDKELVEFNGGSLGKGEEQWKNVRLERNGLGGEERRESACGKRCCAGACGFVFGMFLMGLIMVIFSGCFHHPVEQVSFAVPTNLLCYHPCLLLSPSRVVSSHF